LWLIPDGFLPEGSSGEQESHEAVCVLNTLDKEVSLLISFYFEDREPVEGIRAVVPARRTRHIRTDLPEHLGGIELPRGVPYAVRVESDSPVVVQHSRLDSSQQALALMTTLAYPVA